MTEDSQFQIGSAFFDESVEFDGNTSFSTEFQFQIGGGTNGADGFAFVLHNDLDADDAIGGVGGGLGYRNIEQSIAIEFDSYKNPYDENNNHISLLGNGITDTELVSSDLALDLNSGEVLNAWIDYDGSSDLLEVFVSDTASKPETANLSTTIELQDYLGDRAYVGFSGATGGSSNTHDILNWSFAATQDLESLFAFNDFEEINSLNLNGDAQQQENVLRLTEDSQFQVGSAFFDEPIKLEDNTSFSTEFQFQIGGGTNGADGFAFVLQNNIQGDNALGGVGGGLGYINIDQSVAIEFDSYKNPYDRNNNHISLLGNGITDTELVSSDLTLDLNSGEVLNAWIDYDGSSDLLEVFVSDTIVKPETANLSATIELQDYLGDRARVGFSGATGGGSNTHDILNWSLTSSHGLAPEGDFSEPIAWPSVAIHAGLTPDGKVLTYGLDYNFGPDNNQRNSVFSIWDPKLGNSEDAFNILPMTHAIDSAFCTGMILLPDGTMLIAGGAIQGDQEAGNDLVHLYDYRTGEVAMLPEGEDLLAARWYPTMTSLTDGRILIQGGRSADKSTGVFTPEIYSAEDGASWLNGATSEEVYSNVGGQWWYPRSWVAPNGKVFGFAHDDMYYLDPTGEGSVEIVAKFDGSNIGLTTTAVMYEPGKILQVGGDSFSASIIDINGETPVVTDAADLNYKRIWGDSTVLPDGTVFVNGGSIETNVANGEAYAAEIWDPKTNTWTVVDSADKIRLYHSTSLLLPDGTVLTAGGTTGGFDDDALSGEVYRPAYLYDETGNLAERPTISSEEDNVSWNQSLTAEVGDGDNIERVTLVSFGAVTHSFNMGQRFLDLEFTQSGNSLTVETPESANVAPPGYYMMFAFNDQGVPSEAKIVKLEDSGITVNPQIAQEQAHNQHHHH